MSFSVFKSGLYENFRLSPRTVVSFSQQSAGLLKRPRPSGCCVRHFWLCDGCSRTQVLEYHLGLGVVIRPRHGNLPDGEARPDCLFLSDIQAKCVSRGVIVTC